MKKIILPILVLMILMSMEAFAAISSVTINYPANNQFNSSSTGTITLNASVVWTGTTNVTNLTFWFRGTNNTAFGFTNSTINGSRGTTLGGDFLVNISSSTLNEGAYTMIAEARNDSDVAGTGNPTQSLNSSSITFTIDRTIPVVSLNRPQIGETQTPNSGIITFEYTPTETNLGNCTLYLFGQAVTSSTSGTTNSNVSTGNVNRFTKSFPSDNNSVSWLVGCKDLAGQFANSTARTLNVLVSGSAIITDSSGVVSQGNLQTVIDENGKPLAVATNNLPPVKQGAGFVDNYGWLVLLAVVVGVLYLAFKKSK